MTHIVHVYFISNFIPQSSVDFPPKLHCKKTEFNRILLSFSFFFFFTNFSHNVKKQSFYRILQFFFIFVHFWCPRWQKKSVLQYFLTMYDSMLEITQILAIRRKCIWKIDKYTVNVSYCMVWKTNNEEDKSLLCYSIK